MPRSYRSNRGSVVGPRAQRRKSLWIGLDPASASLAPGAATIFYALNAAALALRPFTVVRTHMEFQVNSDQAAAIENQVLAFGWGVVSDQAFAIGVTAIPTPVTDIGSDLFFLHKVMFGDESALTDRSKSASRYTVDSKAMRKINEDEQPVGVLEVSSAAGGAIVFAGGNMLIKLH